MVTSDDTTTTPTPDGGPRPGPVPRPVPPVPHPVARPAATAVPAPAAPAPAAPAPVDPAATTSDWGRVAEDGTVYVRTADGERAVGQYPTGTPAEALAYFTRKYEDLAAQVALLEQRVAAKAPAGDLGKTVRHLTEQVAGADAVGDLDALARRVATAATTVDELAAAQQQERDRERREAAERRERLVVEAEGIAAQDPARIQWKQTGDRLRELFDEWKSQQRATPRLPRAQEEALWKRFRTARSTFDRKRRTHFSELDAHNAEVRATKQQLVARAEELAGSTDWRDTQSELQSLMDRWRAAGRGGKKSDDALWARFHAAQDTFYQARKAANAAIDAEYEANLTVKLGLLERAEALVPVTDARRAAAELRRIGDEWDEAGRVPRSRFREVEDRFRAVERAVRDAERTSWERTDPEKEARASGLAGQLQEGLDRLAAKLAAAEARGDEDAAGTLREDLEAKRALLGAVRHAGR